LEANDFFGMVDVLGLSAYVGGLGSDGVGLLGRCGGGHTGWTVAADAEVVRGTEDCVCDAWLCIVARFDAW
jgi:hypothetical protein